jgi:hypothetical protein
MELRPISESPQEVLVRFDSELEDEMFNPHQFRLAARNLLSWMKIGPPKTYPYTQVFSEAALYRREEVVHRDNCSVLNDFVPVVEGVRQQLHSRVLVFGAQLRAVSQENWPPYDR